MVEFLRQDDIINIIASKYDGPITDDLRWVVPGVHIVTCCHGIKTVLLLGTLNKYEYIRDS